MPPIGRRSAESLGALGTAIALFLAAAAASGAVVYVNASATGSNDGSTWANAYTRLETALAGANPSDEIWVAAATYRPTTTTDRTASFPLRNDVDVYGGFTGGETLRDQRNPSANVTILSGDIGTPAVATDNSFHVVTADATVTVATTLDGFTITAGRADGANPQDRGGGTWLNGGSPTLGQLLFVGNYASFEGGGLRVTSASPILTDCVFQGNVVAFGGKGGGLYAGGGSSVTARRCVWRSNSLSGSTTGGGIETSGNTTLVNCVVAQNSPNGFQVALGDNNVIADSTFTANSGYAVAFLSSNSNTISNSILWGDSTGEVFLLTGSASVSYSDVQGGFAGTGNIAANPVFRGAPMDLRLGSGSPAVDAGSNALVPGGVTTDIAGLPRFFDDPAVPDTGSGTPPIVDMGAHERIPLSVSDPSDVAVCAGQPAGFSVTASGQPPLSYQWRKNGLDLSDGGAISGATTASLTISPTAVGDSGNYDVLVTDGLGQSLASSAAILVVTAIPVQPAITTPNSVPVGATGVAASTASVGGASYAWSLTGGTITSGQGTSAIQYSAGPPGTLMTLSLVVTVAGCASPTGTALIQVDFLDVPPGHIFHDDISTLARNRVTLGCGGGNYCPDLSVTRAQMAIFLIRGIFGADHIPPPATGMVFADVPTSHFAADYIEEFYSLGITSGCDINPLRYCPDDPVTRAQMAILLLRAKFGAGYMPPAATGIFADVPIGSFADAFIEQLYLLGITDGCAINPPRYCPNDPNTRGSMAVFLVRTFELM